MGKHHEASSPSSIASSAHRPRSRIPLAVTRLRKNDMTLDMEQDREYDSNTTAGSGVKLKADTHDCVDDLSGATVKVEDDSAIDSDEGPSSSVDSETENEVPTQESASLCQFNNHCNTGSHDYRKVISHIFGRNKKCTTQIPEDCWIIYCRKHYQRTRYRQNTTQKGLYFKVQFDSLKRQLNRMEEWGGVDSWTIGIRKKERDLLNAEDRRVAQLRASDGSVDYEAVSDIQRSPERFLLRYIGGNKSWHDVWNLVHRIRQEVERLALTDLPGFELLPNIDSIKYPPLDLKKVAKGETAQNGRSRKRTRLSSSTSRDESTSSGPKRRRLSKRASRHHDSEGDTKLEDEETESSLESADENGSVPQPDTPQVKRSSKAARTTEDILQQGWYAKETHLKTPPSRSATPKTSSVQSDRSASSQHRSRRFDTPNGGSVFASVGETRGKESTHSTSSRPSPLGYDPWPFSNSAEDGARDSKSNTPVSSYGSAKSTKKAAYAYSTPARKAGNRSVGNSSSPDTVAYRPATPKSPRNDHLPEMRLFPTPRAPRTAGPKVSRTPSSDSSPSPLKRVESYVG